MSSESLHTNSENNPDVSLDNHEFSEFHEVPRQQRTHTPQKNNEEQLQQQRVGASVLSRVNFDQRNRAIVDSSFTRALRRGEKLSGKNNDRRNLAYLLRIERMVERYGNRLEKRLWRMSSNRLIIQYEDIEESYWQQQEQILRERGDGHNLSSLDRKRLFQQIQMEQRETLSAWSDFLGAEDSPFPMWFKIYAWDGMSKMGTYDPATKRYNKRDRSTVAPYPKLNAEALAKTYMAVMDFYGQKDGDERQDAEIQDSELQALIKSGNFNAIYSKMILQTKILAKTPERTEDVRGEWIEYLLGQEEDVAVAAEGTHWCISTPATARRYLEYGNFYGTDADRRRVGDSKAKFILFHLHTPDNDVPATNACASIRLNVDGNVAEISGLEDGQCLEDSLVPIVEEKAMSMPGGEKFRQAFADCKHLIELDAKFMRHKPFTEDDLDFVFERTRLIQKLTTRDRRISKLKDIDALLENGTNAEMLAQFLNSKEQLLHFAALDAHGANLDINAIARRLDPVEQMEYFEEISGYGSDLTIDEIVDDVDSYNLTHFLKRLHELNADIDQIASRLDAREQLAHFKELTEYGANLDVDEIVGKLEPYDLVHHLDELLSYGADANAIAKSFGPERQLEYFKELVEHGASLDINRIVRFFSLEERLRHFEELKAFNADLDIDEIAREMEPHQVLFNLGELLMNNADANEIAARLDDYDLITHLGILMEHGLVPDMVIDRLSPGLQLIHYDELRKCGIEVDINEIAAKMDAASRLHRFDELRAQGANLDIAEIVREMPSYSLIFYLDDLLAHNADINEIIQNLDTYDLIMHFAQLKEHAPSLDINAIASNLSVIDQIDYYDKLKELGASIDEEALIKQAEELLAEEEAES